MINEFAVLFEWELAGQTEVLEKKPASVPLRPVCGLRLYEKRLNLYYNLIA
jgi:hypothetical protein